MPDLSVIPATRQLASKAGANRYFTGNPCCRGHLSERFTSSAACVACDIDRQKRWRQANPKQGVARATRHRLKYPERHLSAVKRWQARNPEKTLEINIAWKRSNPDQVLAQGRARRARLKGAVGKHTAADVKVITRAQRGKCAWCREPLSIGQRHVDHIMPLALGGSNDRQNIQVLCRDCNLSKGAKHPIEFAQQQGRLL